jgi:predicted transposase YdaD
MLPGLLQGREIEVLAVEPTELKAMEQRADQVFRTRIDGEETILHVEFQSRHEDDLPERVHAYHALLRLRHRPLPILSLLIYLMHEAPPRPVPRGIFRRPGDRQLDFSYEIFCPWAQPIGLEAVKEYPAIAPLAVLTPGIQEGDLPEVAQAVERAKLSRRQRGDLLVATYILARRRFKEDLLDSWLRSELMEDSPGYEDILRMGRIEGEKRGLVKGEKRGLVKGRAEGEKRGEAIGLRRAILVLVKARLGRSSQRLEKQLGAMNARGLHSLFTRLLRAKDEAHLRTLLPR